MTTLVVGYPPFACARQDRMPTTDATVELRPARRDELPAIRELAGVIWHAHYPGIISVAQIDYMLERGYAIAGLAEFIDRPDRGLLLALAQGEPAGFAAWLVTTRADEAKLDKLYVLQACQRTGIGKALLARVAGDARAAGATTLILNVNKRNTQAIRAYEKHGFTIREAVVNDIGQGYVMDDFVMAKPL